MLVTVEENQRFHLPLVPLTLSKYRPCRRREKGTDDRPSLIIPGSEVTSGKPRPKGIVQTMCPWWKAVAIDFLNPWFLPLTRARNLPLSSTRLSASADPGKCCVTQAVVSVVAFAESRGKTKSRKLKVVGRIAKRGKLWRERSLEFRKETEGHVN